MDGWDKQIIDPDNKQQSAPLRPATSYTSSTSTTRIGKILKIKQPS